MQYGPAYGQIVAELTEAINDAQLIGWTTAEPMITYGSETVSIQELHKLNTAVLEKVYPAKTVETKKEIPAFSHNSTCTITPTVKVAKPNECGRCGECSHLPR